MCDTDSLIMESIFYQFFSIFFSLVYNVLYWVDLFFIIIHKGFVLICHGCINWASNDGLDMEVCISFTLNRKINKAAGKQPPALELL